MGKSYLTKFLSFIHMYSYYQGESYHTPLPLYILPYHATWEHPTIPTTSWFLTISYYEDASYHNKMCLYPNIKYYMDKYIHTTLHLYILTYHARWALVDLGPFFRRSGSGDWGGWRGQDFQETPAVWNGHHKKTPIFNHFSSLLFSLGCPSIVRKCFRFEQ